MAEESLNLARTFFFLTLAEIIMLDGLTVVYRSNVDLYFYVMGSQYENEVKIINRFLFSWCLVEATVE